MAHPNTRLFQFMEERDSILHEVATRVVRDKVRQAHLSDSKSLEYVLNEAAYLEMQRLSGNKPSKLDMRPYGYWQNLAKTVGKASEHEKQKFLRELVDAYCQDVVGKFTPAVFKFATSVLPVGLSVLFNARSVDTLFRNFKKLSDRIIVQGEIETLHKLAEKGTLIVVPTHSSNLDSIVVGWSLEEVGLPPVTYGAGKNLFSNPLTSFFMHNLGAYKVDRRISHTIYKSVLKTYSEVLLERGFHSLFFPGGTRSRSNHIESKLKLGLLGTAMTAYTNNLLAHRPNPNIYVCPLTINYHLTLEAETLIAEHLRRDGGARYIIDDDEFSDISRVAQFVMKTMGMEYTLYLHYAPPLDIFGNPVDGDGNSLDPRGRVIDTERYVWSQGAIAHDTSRDRQYTKRCGEAIAESFRSNTVALSTGFVATVLFEYLCELYPGLDLYQLLRVIKGELIPYDAIYHRAEHLRDHLRDLESHDRIRLSHDVARREIPELVERGAQVLTSFHTPEVVLLRSNGIEVNHPNLLYYYSNRLHDYLPES